MPWTATIGSDTNAACERNTPERLWWENWRDHKWLVVGIVLAVVVMIWVGYAVT